MTKRTISEDNEFENESGDETPAARDTEEFEDQILSDFGSGDDDVRWKIWIWKVDKAVNRADTVEHRIMKLDKSQFGSIFELCTPYGDGLYRIRVYRNGRIWKSHDMYVMNPPKPAMPTGPAPSEMATVLSEMRGMMQQFFDRFGHTQQAPAPAPMDPFAGVEKIAAVMASLQGMMAPKSNETAMQTFMAGVNFARGLEPEERPEGMAGILRDVLNSPVIQKIADAAGQAPPVTQQLNLPPRLPQVTPAAPEPQNFQAPQQPNQTAEPEQNSVVGAIQYLVAKAKSGADSGLYAEWIADNWPPELIQSFLSEPDIAGTLAGFVPEVTNYRSWFESLIDEMKSIMEDDGSVAESDSQHVFGPGSQSGQNGFDPRGRTGDSRNVGHHAQPDTRGAQKPDNPK
ncbi:MAG: hypothetical protein KGJ13_04985 [Patescibacteria group bacterium]|nr:hypothetical protein [Patescibacteria group bacterium]